MRSAVILLTILLPFASACGAPSVDVPTGNDKSTSDPTATESALPAPTVDDAPKQYPYAKLALRGMAGQNALHVFVEGGSTGNPVVGQVNPVNGQYCVDVEVAAS